MERMLKSRENKCVLVEMMDQNHTLVDGIKTNFIAVSYIHCVSKTTLLWLAITLTYINRF